MSDADGASGAFAIRRAFVSGVTYGSGISHQGPVVMRRAQDLRPAPAPSPAPTAGSREPKARSPPIPCPHNHLPKEKSPSLFPADGLLVGGDNVGGNGSRE
jgi:hypothetical protein